MKPTPYLFFNGQARDAIAAYAEIFEVAVPAFMTMADGPPEMDIPEDRKSWVMHCEMQIGEGSVMLSDDFSANSPAMEGCSVMVSLPTAVAGKAVFDKLADGGEIRMAWEPTFWSAGFGTLTDKFGIRWMVTCDGMA
ncbi:VOC family protein [Yoonia sp.]|uniref:VOC family protein n=1 Tax=Yoonia sp. TaxID=2212373 RepID=UPI0025FBA290|nr:VOC family protein [Yoonia sp.]